LEFALAVQSELSAGRKIDKHFRPQFDQCGRGLVRIDFSGRVENFNIDFSDVMKRAGFKDAKIVVADSHSTSSVQLISEYYSSEIADIIYSTFKDDFQFFGYNADWRVLF
jgi:hypothetical protein